MRQMRSGLGAIVAGLVLLSSAAAVLGQAAPGASYPYDGPGVTRLLDHLVSALNAKDEARIADLVAGEAGLRVGPAPDEATDAARTWIEQYGGRNLHGGTFAWRHDLPDGMLTEAQIKAVADDGEHVSIWLTVTGEPIDLEHQNDLVARISAPGADPRVGAAPFSAIPTTGADRARLGTWAVVLGAAGAGLVLAGLALVGLGVRASARSRTAARRGATTRS